MITLYRKLKIPDPEAVTARNTLKDYSLRRLDKMEEFSIDADDEVLDSAINYLYNPNEHFYLVTTGNGTRGNEKAFDVNYDARIRVETEDDPTAIKLFNVLRGRYSHGSKIKSVRRKVVWGVVFPEGEIDVYKKADEMAKELFANPVFQKYEVVV